MADTEDIVWQGSESQVLNTGKFILAFVLSVVVAILALKFLNLLFVLLALPAIYVLYHWLLIRNQKYKITSQRIFYTRGILSARTDQIELYRVKDLDVVEPFMLRMFKKGNIEIDSGDESTPKFIMRAIPDPKNLMDKIRNNVEKRRDLKQTRGVEFMPDPQ